MHSTKSGSNRLVFFSIVVLIGMAISAKLVYSEINASIDLSNQSKLGLRILGHFDKLNSSFTFIERIEKPYIIARKKNSAEEIEEGYRMAFTAFDSLSKSEFQSQLHLNEIDSLKDIVDKKRLISKQVIGLSLLNMPDSAINILNKSNDSLLIRNFYLHFNSILDKIKANINKQQEEHINEAGRMYEVLLITLFFVIALLLFSIFKLNKQIKSKDDLLIQNKNFSDIINFSSDSILMHDQNFKITYCNKATEAFFGYKIEEIIGKDPDAIFNTIASPEFITERRAAIKKNGIWMGELKRKNTNGDMLDVHIALNSFKDFEGNTKGYFSITSNITKLINAQNEVKKLADSLVEVNKGLKNQIAIKAALITDVFERVREVFIGTDHRFNINYANKNIESIFGMQYDELYGMNIKDFLLEITGPEYVEIPQIAFKNNQNKSFVFKQTHTGNSFEANVYPSKNGVSIHFNDVTEKLKSEAEVLKSQKMYEFISKANEHILIAKNADDLFQNICDIAVSFENILFCWIGAPDPITSTLSAIKFAGKEEGYLSAIKAISVKDLPEGNGPSGIAFRTGNYYYVNDIATDPEMLIWREEALKRGYRSDISIPIKVNEKVAYVFTIYTSEPYYFTEEQIALMVNISKNISFALQTFYLADLKKASDQQLQKVLKAIEQSSASIVISDVKGNIEYVNPAFSLLTGYSFDEVIGQNPRILKTGNTSDSEYAHLWENLTHNKEWSGEFCNKKKNGELYWEYAVISPVLNDNGEITNYVAVKENITAQKSLQEDQRRLTKDLIKRNHDLEKFSYVLSHNIRGPLSNILGLKDAILRGINKDEEKGLLQAISISAEAMDQVIRDVTQVISKNKFSLEEKKEIVFDHLLYSVKGDIDNFIQEKSAIIEADFSKVSSCYSLETYISSIFYHLIVNALKFSKHEVPAKIQIWTESYNNKTLIHFKDYGIGIDLNRYGKIIFGLYKRFQLNIEGRGIGLYLVKSQVDFLGGDIEIKSELNEWTEFIISLPNEESVQ